MRRDFPDGAGRARFRTQNTTGFTIADARNEHGRPDAFEASFGERGMQGIVGTNLHAFAATNTASEKIGFLEGAGRTNATITFFRGKGGGGAHQGKHCGADRKAGEDFTALQAGSFAGVALGEKGELEAVMRTFTDAIQAEETFGFSPGHAADRIISALAAQEAAIAVIAGHGILLKAENGPARDESEQRTQGAESATKETSDPEIQGED